MAASEKFPIRRLRRRQLQQQPLSQRQKAADIPIQPFEPSVAQIGRLRRLPSPTRQPQRARFPEPSNLKGWQQRGEQLTRPSAFSSRQGENFSRSQGLGSRPVAPSGLVVLQPQNRLQSRELKRPFSGGLPANTLRERQRLESPFPARRSLQPLAQTRANISRKARMRERGAKKHSAASVGLGRTSVSTRLKQQPRKASPLVYATRLLILGIGLGVVVGTLLSIFDPTRRQSSPAAQILNLFWVKNAASEVAEKPEPQAEAEARSLSLKLSQEIAPLKTQLASLAAQNPLLKPGVFIVDLDTGAYLNWEGDTTFAAASTIKIPILIAFFQDVDAGKIRLDETLIMEAEAIATGSGDMQYQKPGTKYTALETATKMMIISDNTATNMLITRLGGQEVLNQRFREWGLTATVIRNRLPDIEGTNTTTPKELAQLMARINQGELVSLASRDRLLGIMRQTRTNTLLPSGLGKGATIAHKTGNIGALIADAGLIDLPSGKRYIASVMVQRPRNDQKAKELIRKISRIAYQYFNQSVAIPKSPANSITPKNNPVNRLETIPPATAHR